MRVDDRGQRGEDAGTSLVRVATTTTSSTSTSPLAATAAAAAANACGVAAGAEVERVVMDAVPRARPRPGRSQRRPGCRHRQAAGLGGVGGEHVEAAGVADDAEPVAGAAAAGR